MQVMAIFGIVVVSSIIWVSVISAVLLIPDFFRYLKIRSL
jgi:hypothetical protein